MPTYDYECQKCGHRYELFQSIRQGPRRTCPKCKGRVKRLLGTGAGVIFKGSGFYATDYRTASYKDAAKKDTATPTTAAPKTKEAGGATKSDKPAATKD